MPAHPPRLPMLGKPAEAADERGMCRSCRFFVDNPFEVHEEMRRYGHVLTAARERPVDGEGVEHGEERVPTATLSPSLAAAFRQRLGVDPADMGLCEKGVAAFVHRNAGNTTDESGRRIDQCPRWAAKTAEARGDGWQARRAAALAIGARLEAEAAAPSVRVTAADPCPWHPGQLFIRCCGRDLATRLTRPR